MAKGIKANGLKIAKARLELPGPPTQAEFARRIGIHWVTQSKIENGKANISLELLERIAEETGKKRDHFLGDDDAEAAPMAAGGPLTPAEVEILGDLMGRLIRPAASFPTPTAVEV